MPELPEVEVVRQGLAQICASQPVLTKMVFHRKDLRFALPKARLQKLCGQRVLSVQRRAKYLLLQLESGGLLSHLGMTGTWREDSASYERRTHDHVELHLGQGKVLVYNDPRRFGFIDTWSEAAPSPFLKHLGPEPLSDQFTADWLVGQLKGRSSSIKASIMDQKVVVGVGNIYASEALFLAGIRPLRRAGGVKRVELQKLVLSIQQVLSAAIQAGGSSISDFYSFGGLKGGFQELHRVYGREGESCSICQSTIRAAVIAGRNSFWCTQCQK